MKTIWTKILALVLLVPSTALAQPGAATLNPRGGLNQSPTWVNFNPYYWGAGYVNMPVYGPWGPGYQNVPVLPWADPAYQWYANYNFWQTGIYIPPPITYGPDLFGPPLIGPVPYGVPSPNFMLPENPPPQNPPANAEPPANGAKKPAPKDAKPGFDHVAAMIKDLEVGNAAFAAGNSITALRHYEAASQHQPLDALPLFHQAQAQIALGQYAKAVALIQRGLKWKPDWPTSAFKPRTLYGERANTFDLHLAGLASAVEQKPTDASLLFLLGYQLWFDGKQDQAKILFRRAATQTLDTAAIDRFLK